jgi:hypothetical protein
MPRRLRPKATLNQSLRSNFSAQHAMAVGWTVAAGVNRRTPCIPIPSNQPRKLRPAPLFNLLLTNHFSLITARLAVGSSVRAHLTLAEDDQVMEHVRNHASIYIEVEGIDAL